VSLREAGFLVPQKDRRRRPGAYLEESPMHLSRIEFDGFRNLTDGRVSEVL
jgi:hypothetical protein